MKEFFAFLVILVLVVVAFGIGIQCGQANEKFRECQRAGGTDYRSGICYKSTEIDAGH